MKQKNREATAKRQTGVALLEVLVSVLLFSLGILGLIGLQTRAISFSSDAEDRNRAALLANDIASEMWLTKSVTIDTSKGSAWQTRVSSADKGGLPNGAVEVTAASAISADIKITWQAPARATGEQSTLVTRVTLPSL
ncbi:type IV pilus assembly protein PilV [Variovorax paradoxus]|uniref:type IV pilus modification protein PilV n=1 Tax=Variovorax paradoxus TaxID=34073 RepID=UPI00278B4A1F|nr:type IV pilus modification protein PilV [Variovorax paradoxus]MDQ0025750.1 type IV pilus assembly protein PilV [Variovorax paradoxus]